MNIILIAIAERTHKIGVRWSIRAKQADLLIKFLLEVLYMCIIGPISGLILGKYSSMSASSVSPIEAL